MFNHFLIFLTFLLSFPLFYLLFLLLSLFCYCLCGSYSIKVNLIYCDWTFRWLLSMLNLLSLTASCLASPRLFFALLPPPLPLPDDGAVCKCWLSIIALCGPTVTKCVWLNWPRRRRRCRVGVKKPERHPFAWCLVFLLSSVLCLLSWVLTLESVCHAKCRSTSRHKCSQDPHFGWWSCWWRRWWWWCLWHWGDCLEKLPSIVYRNLCKLP